MKPALDAGLVIYSSSTGDLDLFRADKTREYRESTLQGAYSSPMRPRRIEPRWIPRHLSSSGHIRRRWLEELEAPDGLWQRLLRSHRSQRQAVLPFGIEDHIAAIPEDLDGRAFIFKFAAPLLPLRLNTNEAVDVNMLINRAYLESYLDEYQAAILVDTPLGSFDCELPRDGARLRTVSFSILHRLFTLLGVRRAIESELDWYQVVELREHVSVTWAIEAALQDFSAFSEAAVLSQWDRGRGRGRGRLQRDPLQGVLDRFQRLHLSLHRAFGGYRDCGRLGEPPLSGVPAIGSLGNRFSPYAPVSATNVTIDTLLINAGGVDMSDNRISVGGNANLNIDSVLTNVTQSIQSMDAPTTKRAELESLVNVLLEQIRSVKMTAPDEAELLGKRLEETIQLAHKKKVSGSIWTVTTEGLLAAARAVSGVLPLALDSAQKIIEFIARMSG